MLAAAREIERSGYTVVRYSGRNGDGSSGQSLRTLARASEVVAETKIVRIIVGLRSSAEELPLRQLLEQRLGGVPVETGHEAYERLTGKIFLDERTPLHLLVSHACLSSRLYGRMKRCVSAIVAAVALVPALPVMALIALSIHLADKGPVLFVQERVGLHGRPFRLLKFRTMGDKKDTSSEWERDNENRITPPGRWLRKLHLDELPQLWNILRGDMDLVGPRPHPVSNYELFARSIPYYSLRSLVRPGLTGGPRCDKATPTTSRARSRRCATTSVRSPDRRFGATCGCFSRPRRSFCWVIRSEARRRGLPRRRSATTASPFH